MANLNLILANLKNIVKTSIEERESLGINREFSVRGFFPVLPEDIVYIFLLSQNNFRTHGFSRFQYELITTAGSRFTLVH